MVPYDAIYRKPPLLVVCALFRVLRAITAQVSSDITHDAALMYADAPWTYAINELFDNYPSNFYQAANTAETSLENSFLRVAEHTQRAIFVYANLESGGHDVSLALDYARTCVQEGGMSYAESSAYITRIFMEVIENYATNEGFPADV